jgi:acyl carrier protein
MLQDDLQAVFRKVFEDPALVITDDMSAADIEKWDSLAHINLIVEVEKFFGARFKNAEIARLQCIGDLKKLVTKHRPELA